MGEGLPWNIVLTFGLLCFLAGINSYNQDMARIKKKKMGNPWNKYKRS
jgi:hypothetical protein